MRVTEGTISATILNSIQLGQQRLDQLQQQVSTGLKVSTPGDDPVAAQQILQLKGALQDSAQYARNITTGSAWLTQEDSAMDDMGNVVTRVREIVQEMASGTYNATDRANAASEVKQLKSQLIQLGNSQVAGRYLFGGYVSDKPPFDTTAITTTSDPLNGTPTGIYAGTDDPVNMEVEGGTYVAINYSGGKLLRGGTPPGSSGTDLIGTLNNLITALSANDVSSIQGTITNLDAAQNQITSARADVGGRMNRIQSASGNLDSMKVSLNTAVSDKQNADLLQVVSDLTSQQTAFQATLAASAKTSQLSLLDYLK